MPYVNCSRCGLVNHTVAHWSGIDGCAACGQPLRRPTGSRASGLRPPAPLKKRVPRSPKVAASKSLTAGSGGPGLPAG